MYLKLSRRTVKMRAEGFEPSQALSYYGLNVTRLTTPAHPH